MTLPLCLAMTMILFVVSIATSMISAVTGMAGGIVLLSFMTLILPHHVLIPLHGMVQLISNSSRAITLFKEIRWSLLLPFCIGLPFGVFLSLYIIRQIDNKEIFLLLIALLIFYSLFKPKAKTNYLLPAKLYFVVGLISGFLSLLVGATGPFLAPFFLRDDLNKRELIASKSFAQFSTHLLKIPAFLSLGFDYQAYSLLIIILSIAAITGTVIGVKVLNSIPEALFLKIFRAILFVIACRLVIVALI
jgi:uncharacterized protein